MHLSVKNVSKIYNQHIVIQQFEYEFETGLYLFRGENGSGKSTLLKIIAGLIKPTNRDYFISKLKKSYLCERIELLDMRVYEYLLWFCKDYARVKKLISLFRLPNKRIKHLSKGNKQKVALLMVYLTDADVYLFDEPTDALDSEAIIFFEKLLQDLLAKKKIIIIATHEIKYFDNLAYKEIAFNENIVAASS